MFVADTINFREIAMKESLPLAAIQSAVIDFLRGRNDAVLFGAQAVNVYVAEPRATQDLDLMSTRASGLAEELRRHLGQLFHIAVHVPEIKGGLGYRIFQLRKGGNRHLVDIRSIAALPETRTIDGVQVLSPSELIAKKVASHWRRRGKPKSWTDRRDIAVLLQAFPDLKTHAGPVTNCLAKAQADPGVQHVSGNDRRCKNRLKRSPRYSRIIGLLCQSRRLKPAGAPLASMLPACDAGEKSRRRVQIRASRPLVRRGE